LSFYPFHVIETGEESQGDEKRKYSSHKKEKKIFPTLPPTDAKKTENLRESFPRNKGKLSPFPPKNLAMKGGALGEAIRVEKG